MKDWTPYLLSYLGLFLWIASFARWSVRLSSADAFWKKWTSIFQTASKKTPLQMRQEPCDEIFLTVVVPARNEESNLPIFQTSFQNLRSLGDGIFQAGPLRIQWILVDDHSQDRTHSLAQQYGAQVISAAERPKDWTGKSWACHQAKDHILGSWVLFTDADTQHFFHRWLEDFYQESLSKNIFADLICAQSFHRTELWWEKLLGPFFALLMVATRAQWPARQGSVYCNGQFLLFHTKSYVAMRGHELVKKDLAEDLAFTRQYLQNGKVYELWHPENPLFHVRMYSNFQEFFQGWRRNFHLGFSNSHITSTAEVFFALAGLTGSFRLGQSIFLLIPCLASLVLIAVRQKKWGQFSILGVLLFPFSITLFILISMAAAWDQLRKNPIRWKGRIYSRGV